ncbi:protein of unknown function [Vibrio tapetis subsp. tapetis]|uniref:Uncharacterized protein n=1 Tax=Vibrio tapetis subsp. tapetis TaxID=1671868 RepID=A0A2N8ZGW7_9VIBR|nr:protein of unknown function [Vibrio tapetis subsp. tapetis]
MRYQAALFTDIGFILINQKRKLMGLVTELMGWLTRFELATTGITIQGSTN